MKLIYRGVTYDYDPTQPRDRDFDRRFETVREPVTLKYRGHSYQFDPSYRAEESEQTRSNYELVYRGDRYWVHANGERAAATVKPASTQPKLTNIHQANLQRNLQHRIQVAREKGDQALLALLEAEQRQLV